MTGDRSGAASRRAASTGPAAPAEAGDPESNLAAHPSLAVRLRHAERLLVDRLSPDLESRGLTLDHWRMLCVLAERPGLPMSALADAACVPPPTLTRYVDKLVQRGVLVRMADRTDRRKVVVAPSELGSRIHADLSAIERSIERDLAGDLAIL